MQSWVFMIFIWTEQKKKVSHCCSFMLSWHIFTGGLALLFQGRQPQIVFCRNRDFSKLRWIKFPQQLGSILPRSTIQSHISVSLCINMQYITCSIISLFPVTYSICMGTDPNWVKRSPHSGNHSYICKPSLYAGSVSPWLHLSFSFCLIFAG